MDIELVTIGDELLLGFTVDTNSAHIARVLADCGVRVVRRATVGDDPDHIVSALHDALRRTGAVLTTGGLGPTTDDRTHESIARAFDRPLELHNEGLSALAERWQQRFGRPMPESNRRQFMLPQGATVLQNRHGSAPGVWCEDERGRWVATMPGVPREMRGMLADAILPRISERLEAAGQSLTTRQVIRSRTLRTTGISESAIADHLAEYRSAVADIPIAYLPGLDGVDVRLTVSGLNARDADVALQRAAETVRARVGKWIYGEDNDNLAALVLTGLAAHAHSIAVAESCTGGLLGARLTSVPGASRHVLGGVIAYDNRIKTELLGVPATLIAQFGAVSEPVARAMASGVRQRFGADVGIGVTGIAGPDGGTPEKPVGTVWIAVDIAGVVHAVKPVLPGDRNEIRHRATQIALERVRRVYAGEADLPGWTVSAERAIGANSTPETGRVD